MSTTIRVSDETRDRLARLAEADSRTMTSILDDALDALERRRFFAAFNERFRQLRSDDEAWSAIESERAGESTTLADGTR